MTTIDLPECEDAVPSSEPVRLNEIAQCADCSQRTGGRRPGLRRCSRWPPRSKRTGASEAGGRAGLPGAVRGEAHLRRAGAPRGAVRARGHPPVQRRTGRRDGAGRPVGGRGRPALRGGAEPGDLPQPRPLRVDDPGGARGADGQPVGGDRRLRRQAAHLAGAGARRRPGAAHGGRAHPRRGRRGRRAAGLPPGDQTADGIVGTARGGGARPGRGADRPGAPGRPALTAPAHRLPAGTRRQTGTRHPGDRGREHGRGRDVPLRGRLAHQHRPGRALRAGS